MPDNREYNRHEGDAASAQATVSAGEAATRRSATAGTDGPADNDSKAEGGTADGQTETHDEADGMDRDGDDACGQLMDSLLEM